MLRFWDRFLESGIHDPEPSRLPVDRYLDLLGIALIKGVGRHAQEVGNWLIHVEPWGRYERFRVPQGWEGDGIIARISEQALAEEIAAMGLPAVNVSWYPASGERIAQCTVDPVISGQMAAEYFLSAGHKQFAFCGPLRRARISRRLGRVVSARP